MANFFYIDITGTKQGPITAAQLKDLANRGIITPETPLETDSGLKGLAKQIKGLFPDFIPLPKPSPRVNPVSPPLPQYQQPPQHAPQPKNQPSTLPNRYNGNNPFVWWWIVMSKYADFSGRARRKEYWMFLLVSAILFLPGIFLLDAMAGIAGEGEQFARSICNIWDNIWYLAVFLPSLAVCVRRLHDIGESGWLILLASVYIIGYRILFIIPISENRVFYTWTFFDIVYGGWVVLYPFGWIVLFIWSIRDSKPGANKYGPNPKGL